MCFCGRIRGRCERRTSDNCRWNDEKLEMSWVARVLGCGSKIHDWCERNVFVIYFLCFLNPNLTDVVGSAGSFLDGGANAPLQRFSIPLLDMDFVQKDAKSLQKHFRKVCNFALKKLQKKIYHANFNFCIETRYDGH